jgi:hypothetical protein
LPALQRHWTGGVVTVTPRCLSPHVSKPKPDHMCLVWRPPHSAEVRVRVIAWTCDCRTPFFELCHAAGVAYIRRTQLNEVHETYRWSFKEAEAVWRALLGGDAR